ncbi:MAG: hypothetical protein LIP09_14145 [Bacteroidales bacterium]|nr:hypothetical protein [Bacteroidales bacterium]MCC8119869.1 hypothetical protein [Bacteroidales bacterium]
MTILEQDTMHAVKAAARAIASKEINWEQRRYEIVKDAYCACIVKGKVISLESIIRDADIIIAELKKNDSNK